MDSGSGLHSAAETRVNVLMAAVSE